MKSILIGLGICITLAHSQSVSSTTEAGLSEARGTECMEDEAKGNPPHPAKPGLCLKNVCEDGTNINLDVKGDKVAFANQVCKNSSADWFYENSKNPILYWHVCHRAAPDGRIRCKCIGKLDDQVSGKGAARKQKE